MTNIINWPAAATLIIAIFVGGILFHFGKIKTIKTREIEVSSGEGNQEKANILVKPSTEKKLLPISGQYRCSFIYPNYILHYNVVLAQKGDRVEGEGTKIEELTFDGKLIQTPGTLPLKINGYPAEGRWKLEMTELGNNNKLYNTEIFLAETQTKAGLISGNSNNSNHGRAFVELETLDQRISAK